MTVINNLKTSYQFFLSLNWVQKLLAISVVLLSAAWVFTVLTPAQVPVQTQVLTHITPDPVDLNNIEFRGNLPVAPSQLPMATAEYQDVSETLLQSLFSAFSVSTTPITEGVWSGPEYEVVEISQPELYSVIRRTRVVEPSVLTPINTQQAVEEATQIINGIYSFGPKPQVIASDIEILGDNHENDLDGESRQEFIRIPFAYLVETIPIYVGQDTFYPAELILDSSYSLVKATFSPYTLDVSINRNYKTISSAEAVGRINQNQAAIVFYMYEGPRSADFSNVQSGILNQVEIEYRLDPSTNTVAPYYNFGGTLRNSAGYEIETQLITPALRTDFSTAN